MHYKVGQSIAIQGVVVVMVGVLHSVGVLRDPNSFAGGFIISCDLFIVGWLFVCLD